MRKEMELIAQVQAGTQSLKPSISAEHRLISKAIFTPTHTFTYVIYLKAPHTGGAPTRVVFYSYWLRNPLCLFINNASSYPVNLIPVTLICLHAFK